MTGQLPLTIVIPVTDLTTGATILRHDRPEVVHHVEYLPRQADPGPYAPGPWVWVQTNQCAQGGGIHYRPTDTVEVTP